MDEVDTAALTAAAWRVEDLAGVLRARGYLLAAHAAALRWRSPAARLFFARVEGALAQLADCSAQSDALAEAMRARASRLGRLP
jgi:hypothetical protein